MTTKTAKTIVIEIYMAGDIQHAKQLCRKYCTGIGFCVTIHDTEYIYKGGYEAGFVVGVRNYPRFNCDAVYLTEGAEDLARYLRAELSQDSSMIVTPTDTIWTTNRKVPE